MSEPQKMMKLYNELVKSVIYEFPDKGKVNISKKQGVYIVYDNKSQPLHVGKTNGAKNGLNDRLQNHVWNQSSFSKLYMQKNKIVLRDWGKFQFIVLEDDRERALLEALTAGLLCPAHIGTGVKK
ncbi:GIY-YIG nuclease family protein [Hanstruepera ponticola]|uniref:hypothetical protein n=1 Tax=Hanstruepera ponticola TaxID=2042995 RepID=UPI00177B7669|nr:hypothetical protein [Hanstruepera ponticola]